MIEILNANDLLIHEIENDPDAACKTPIQEKTILFVGTFSALIESKIREYGFDTINADSVHEARNFLTSACFNENHPLPDAIFCDMHLDLYFISHFAKYLSITKKFKDIPFLLLSKENQETTNISNLAGIDDIITYNLPIADLLDKINVLKKYKKFKTTLPYQVGRAQKQYVSTKHIIRRTVDILLGSAIFIALLPLFLLVSIAILIDSKGSILYVSPRAGTGYRVFRFYKFRTMVVDADKKIDQIKHLNQYNFSDSKGTVFIKIDKDPRITRVGRFLRNTSIDELPQLLNVIIGDMSLVGNRPLPLYEACSLTVDDTVQRFLAPAGMTGLWQIKGRGRNNMSAQERINLDIDYANKYSFFYDMRILLHTPKGLMQKTNV